jgi:hypothetical protein
MSQETANMVRFHLSFISPPSSVENTLKLAQEVCQLWNEIELLKEEIKSLKEKPR